MCFEVVRRNMILIWRRTPKFMSKPRKKLTPQQIEQIRFAYCSGAFPVNSIARDNEISYKRLWALAKKMGWRRESGRNGLALTPDIPDLVIQGNKVVYCGPLTEAERETLNKITACHAKDVLTRHDNVTSKTLILAEMALDKLLVNNGMVKKQLVVGKGAEQKVVEVMVPGTEELHALASILAKTIPLERLTYGLDSLPAFGDKGEAGLRAKERQDVLVEEITMRFTKRIEKLRTITNGHAAQLEAPAPEHHA